MKMLNAVLFGVLAMITSAVHAAPEDPFSVGVFLGHTNADLQARYTNALTTFEADDSNTESLALNFSYYFTDWFAIDVFGTGDIKADDLFREVEIEPGEGSDFEVGKNSGGVYALFQWGSEIYMKGRIGLGVSEITFETADNKSTHRSIGYSYGVSIGKRFGIGSLELSYIRNPDVKVSQTDFAEDFSGSAGNTLIVRRQVTYETFAAGYVFHF